MKKSIKKVVNSIKLRKKDSKLTQRKNEYLKDLTDKYNLPVPRYQGTEKFTIISAVYGVEKYLDKFITSIVKQTISFEENIQLILVDDGSLDGSSKICQEWQCRFPNNIFYVRKENGGQASARNYGLQYAKHEWVSYIDPDDFIDSRYLENIDSTLNGISSKISMISCKLVFFKESSYSYSDSHPLKERFSHGNRIVKINDELDDFQLSASTAFFRKSSIENNKIKFESIKPNFEDGHFVCKYMINNMQSNLLFISDSLYFYRKRDDESSTLDTAWERDEKYKEIFEKGYLDILNYSKEKIGYIPNWLKNTIIYDTSWYFKYFANNHRRYSAINEDLVKSMLGKLRETYAYIESEYFKNCNVPRLSNYHKTGILKTIYGIELLPEFFYLHAYDQSSNMLGLMCLSGEKHLNVVFRDNLKPVEIIHRKTSHQTFLNNEFLYETFFWIKSDSLGELSIDIDGKKIPIKCGRNRLDKIGFQSAIKLASKTKRNLNKNRVASIYRKLCQTNYYKNKYRDCWLFMDRDNQADDNAEHLYRYVRDNHKEKNIYFILKKSSSDWNRLKNDNFKLLDFGSLDHIMALLNSNFLASSHADHYVTNLLNNKFYGDVLNYQFIFLQHGTIKDDLSEWLNGKNIRHFICSSTAEYESIVTDDSSYLFTSREVVLTGLPRHDALLKKSKHVEKKRKIVIMPTWRQNFMGKTMGISAQRAINENFKNTEYYKKWFDFINSNKLKSLSEKYDYEFDFFPHVNAQEYFKDINIEHVNILSNDDIESIQNLFCEAKLLVTDYSSVAFDMAYLNKPTIYYQFDRDLVFGGGHTTKPGYFDYFNDGFGPVCETVSDLLIELEKTLEIDGAVERFYQDRVGEVFPFHDGNCCNRIYKIMKESENKS
ncbi:CDP-glycerol:glycerophosphate glycerophosphotransferase [Vibrio splendidus]